MSKIKVARQWQMSDSFQKHVCELQYFDCHKSLDLRPANLASTFLHLQIAIHIHLQQSLMKFPHLHSTILVCPSSANWGELAWPVSIRWCQVFNSTIFSAELFLKNLKDSMSKCQKIKKKMISSKQWLLVVVFWDVVAVELLIVFLPSNFLKFITQVNTDFIKATKLVVALVPRFYWWCGITASAKSIGTSSISYSYLCRGIFC